MKRPVALITGASSGIGAALAREYALRGWSLILVARREGRLREVAESCKALFPVIETRVFVSDVSAPDFAAQLEKFLAGALGPGQGLDAAYVNAGVGGAGRFEKLPLDAYRRVFETNVIGALRTVQGSLEALKKSRGKLVFIASMNSYLALPLGTPYNMSKFAVRALGESLYCELAPFGIQVSVANPGPVRTEILSLDNHGKPAPGAKEFFDGKPALDAAVAARRLVSKVERGKREFTLSWSTDALLWIHRHFPWLTTRLIRWVYSRYEKKFAELVGKINPDSV